MKKKKIIPIILICVLVLFLGYLLYVVLVVNTPENRTNKANDVLDKYGGIFYSHYYDSVESEAKDETKRILSEYKDTGLTISLKDLRIYLDTYKMEDYSSVEKCNQEQTKITVFPVDPYGKQDFNVRVILECPFSK